MARTVRRNIGFFHALLSLGRADPDISPMVQRIDLYAAEGLYVCLRGRRMVADADDSDPLFRESFRRVILRR